MLCSNPYMKTKTGVRPYHIVNEHNRSAVMPFGCGCCLNCRITLSQVWRHRLLLEYKTAEKAVFVTRTMANHNLPDDLSVDIEETKKFLKRLRDRIGKFRYFTIGEYGSEERYEKTDPKNWVPLRPHYHDIIFGHDESVHMDIYKAWNRCKPSEIRKGPNGKFYYNPNEIGTITVTPFNDLRAGYISGYTTSKLYKNKYVVEEYGRKGEFASQSKMEGGLGLQATLRAGEVMLKDPNFDPSEKIIEFFQYGKKKLPLGRYLTNALAEYLGTPECLFENRKLEHETEFFTKYVFGKDTEEHEWFNGMMRESEAKRRSRAWRWKTKQKRKEIL